MMRELRFYKEQDSRWYVELKDWEGSKAELEMVGGADTALDMMSGNGTEVTLKVSMYDFEGAGVVKKDYNLTAEQGGGAMYTLCSFEGQTMKHELWLCDVLKYVFSTFPDFLFIKKIKL